MQDTDDSKKQTHKPNVPLPAPVYFGLSIALGFALSRLHPLSVNTYPVLYYCGWVINALAAVLLLWCFALFIRQRTTIMPSNPVSALVIAGPYRYSRNPMYVSLALFHLGIMLNTGNLWQAFTFLPHILAVRYWVIAPEEIYMRSRFGSAYAAYATRVRRWL
ncbi:MAG: isoprenylcysteine carboxylmethyltransferase family protein [Salinisphaeraceae bacterium]|nr:isoprenylcysteine carboxylmethyltransferase family protein [Salinisphaeraceae bacterium]